VIVKKINVQFFSFLLNPLTVMLLMKARDGEIDAHFGSVIKLSWLINAYGTPFLFSNLTNE
jgi:hypothetical protein